MVYSRSNNIMSSWSMGRRKSTHGLMSEALDRLRARLSLLSANSVIHQLEGVFSGSRSNCIVVSLSNMYYHRSKG